MAEVKTQMSCIIQGTLLLYMSAEYLPQCFLKQMRCCMVFAGCAAVFLINRQRHLVIQLEHAAYHIAHMTDFAAF